MNKKFKVILCFVLTFCILAMVFGLINLVNIIPDYSIGDKDITILSDDWSYSTDISSDKQTVNLPNKLDIPNNTTKIELINKLPETIVDGAILKMGVMFQQTNIYIDGKLRVSYGDSNAEMFTYPYVNATHDVVLKLNPKDCGKEIKIVLSARKAFWGELSLVNVPEIGQDSAFVLRALTDPSSSVLVNCLFLIIIIIIFIVCFMRFLQKQPVFKLACFMFFITIWFAFNLTDSKLWYSLYDYSPLYSAMIDLIFYIIDPILPILSFVVLAAVFNFKLNPWKQRFIYAQCFIYIIATFLHLTGVFSINYFRPILMIFALFNFSNVFIAILPKIKKAQNKYFGIATLILLFGYFIDYLKYVLCLLPFPPKILVFLNMKMPFMMFLSIALPAFFCTVLYAILMLFQNEQIKLRKKLNIDALTKVYTRLALSEEFDNIISGKTESTACYFAMIDIDDFKTVNDTYGHSVGDEILKTLGRILIADFSNIKPFRFGGDEFCLFLYSDQLDETMKKLKEIQEEFSEKSELYTNNIKVTLSIGITEWKPLQSPSELIMHADKALYQSKKLSKNTITVFKKEKI